MYEVVLFCVLMIRIIILNLWVKMTTHVRFHWLQYWVSALESYLHDTLHVLVFIQQQPSVDVSKFIVVWEMVRTQGWPHGEWVAPCTGLLAGRGREKEGYKTLGGKMLTQSSIFKILGAFLLMSPCFKSVFLWRIFTGVVFVIFIH